MNKKIIKATNSYATIFQNQLYYGDWNFPKNEENLSKLNITTIIDFVVYYSNDEIPKYSPKYNYIHFPIKDDPLGSINWCEKVSVLIENEIKKGSVVYVHCVAGISRSTTCVLYYLMTRHNKTLKDSYELIKKERHVASPVYGFFKGLSELDLKIFGKVSITPDEYVLSILCENFPSIKEANIKEIWEETKQYYESNPGEYEKDKVKDGKSTEPIGIRTYEKIYEKFGKDKQVERYGLFQKHPFQ